MNTLSVSAVELSRFINIDQTSISRWRSGKRRPLVDMPYFDKIIDFFIQKNKSIGNNLLEDYFKGIYILPEDKKPDTEFLRKCIRNYIMDIAQAQLPSLDLSTYQNDSSFVCISYDGIEGRRNALISVLDVALKSTDPVIVKIFSCDHMEWLYCDMQYLYMFYSKIKCLLSLGHKVELLLNFNQGEEVNLEAHKYFMELSFYNKMVIYNLPSRMRKMLGMNLYIIPNKIGVVSYSGNNADNGGAFSFRDRKYINANENIFESMKSQSTHIISSDKISDLNHIVDMLKAEQKKNKAYYYCAKTLSFTTMSEELLEEVLQANKLSDQVKQRCFETYYMFRTYIENTTSDPASGFYYSLDELLSSLSFKSVINYSLSVAAGKIVTVTREQYLRHFKDTADILLKDERYKIFLHNSHVCSSKVLWYCDHTWAMASNFDEFDEKMRFAFTDDINFIAIFKNSFQNVYDRLSDNAKDNQKITEIFIKISNGEKV